MNTIAAVCIVHGAFPSRAFAFSNVNNLTLSGNSESCPKCGRQSKIVDGAFTIAASGIVEILSAPGWTRDALREVQQALQSVHRNQTDQNPEAQLRHLQDVSPQTAQLITAATTGWTRDQKLQLWTLLITFLSFLLSTVSFHQGSSQELSPAEIAVIVEEAMKQVKEGIEGESVPPISPLAPK